MRRRIPEPKLKVFSSSNLIGDVFETVKNNNIDTEYNKTQQSQNVETRRR
jgi:hypothetical protein